jgi:hypothetical protein
LHDIHRARLLDLATQFPASRITLDHPGDSTGGMMGTKVRVVETDRLRLPDRLTTRTAQNNHSILIPCFIRSHKHLLGLQEAQELLLPSVQESTSPDTIMLRPGLVLEEKFITSCN